MSCGNILTTIPLITQLNYSGSSYYGLSATHSPSSARGLINDSSLSAFVHFFLYFMGPSVAYCSKSSKTNYGGLLN